MNNSLLSDADIIHSYSREQALEDGFLLDLSERAREAGIRFPVAITRTAWLAAIGLPSGDACQDQSEEGRARDVRMVMRYAALRAGDSALAVFTLQVKQNGHTSRNVELQAVVTIGDSAEPVITIMLPGED
jgi:hypothetical protein